MIIPQNCGSSPKTNESALDTGRFLKWQLRQEGGKAMRCFPPSLSHPVPSVWRFDKPCCLPGIYNSRKQYLLHVVESHVAQLLAAPRVRISRTCEHTDMVWLNCHDACKWNTNARADKQGVRCFQSFYCIFFCHSERIYWDIIYHCSSTVADIFWEINNNRSALDRWS